MHVVRQVFGHITSDHSLHPPHETGLKYGDVETMIFNVNGSALTNSRKLDFRGFVRNHEDFIQFAFYDGVKISNVIHVEIKVLFIGIELCSHANYKKILCLYDSFHMLFS